MSVVPFTAGIVLPHIQQTLEDRRFSMRNLEEGLLSGVYEYLFQSYVDMCTHRGLVVSSAFVVWHDDGVDRKGRFGINFHRQINHWPRGSFKMESE